MATAITTGGDPDVASVAALFADTTRARILMALGDGRSLPATVLAAEAGVTPQAASAQLARLLAAGLLAVEQSGRHRYYRLASAHVGTVLEALAELAPIQPVRSLRDSTRAAALRRARTCYDHLAGRLGVAITQALVDHHALTPIDGIPDIRRRPGDRLSSQLPDHVYILGTAAVPVLTSLGVAADRLADSRASRRPLLRFCLDWTEQRHHLAGRLGADLLAAFKTAGWVTVAPTRRVIRVTPAGSQALHTRLGLELDALLLRDRFVSGGYLRPRVREDLSLCGEQARLGGCQADGPVVPRPVRAPA
jgi:DNA-binding transcriptional ArsR family regulator